MAMDRIVDGRIDYYRSEVFAQTKRKTPLEGVKVGGVGADIRIGQKIRAWVVVDEYPDNSPESKDVLGFDLELKARVNGFTREPELLLIGRRKDKIGHLVIPQSAIQRGHFGAYEFGKPSAEIEQLEVGQVVEGVSPRGERRAFFVAGVKEDRDKAKGLLLETLDSDPRRVEAYTKDGGRLILADQYRVVMETIRDLTTWAQEAAANGVDVKPLMTPALKTP